MCDAPTEAQRLRPWVARGCYPNLLNFYFGTVFCDVRAKDHEVRAAIEAKWALVFPFPMPSNWVPVHGGLSFVAGG